MKVGDRRRFSCRYEGCLRAFHTRTGLERHERMRHGWRKDAGRPQELVAVGCPKCDVWLYHCDPPLKLGDVVDASRFMPLETEIPQPRNGSPRLCPLCGSSLGDGSRFFMEELA